MKKLSLLFIASLLLSSCWLRKSESFDSAPLRVRVQVMSADTMMSSVTYVGEIVERSSVSLSPSAAGRVVAVHVSAAERVKAGQVLLEIDSTQALHLLTSAQALLHQAEDGVERARKIYAGGGITEQKWVELQTQLAEARSLYASASQAVADCRLTAPIAGVIGKVDVQVGQMVSPALPLITLLNTDAYNVHFSVPESEIAAIRVGTHARMLVPALGTQTRDVVITEKSLIPNRLTHTYPLKASIAHDDSLLPGMTAKVQLTYHDQTGFLLPQSAVQLLSDGAKVWLVQDSVAVRQTVTVGKYVQDGVLITDGLSQGDRVVVEGYQKLYKGAKIQEID